MPPSAKLRTLEKRIQALRQVFLPQFFSGVGAYSPAQLDGARAFRVLVHAEIEDFIEGRALEVAKQAVTRWNTNQKVSKTLIHLLSNQIGHTAGLPTKIGSDLDATAIVKKCWTQFNADKVKNHGIRIANILSMLLPVGIDEAEIDSVWLSTIDGFGAARGKAAHSSAIEYTINPQDDYNTVQSIILGLRDIDATLSRLKRSTS
jgi:hypothetical protein